MSKPKGSRKELRPHDAESNLSAVQKLGISADTVWFGASSSELRVRVKDLSSCIKSLRSGSGP